MVFVQRVRTRARGRADKEGAPAAQKFGDEPRRSSLLEGMSSEERKKYPVTTGVFDYFRDALFAVARVSYAGNEKHNPGQPLHWARGKSVDDIDALGRHLLERDEIDPDTQEIVLAQAAWRALATLQKALEKKYNIMPPPACKFSDYVSNRVFDGTRPLSADRAALLRASYQRNLVKPEN